MEIDGRETRGRVFTIYLPLLPAKIFKCGHEKRQVGWLAVIGLLRELQTKEN